MRLIDADPFGVIFLQGKSEEFIEGVNFILDKIYEAPTVEERPHGEWIPCSERLPDVGGYFLITNIDELVRLDYFRKSTNDFDNYSAIAWKPLPEPYKRGEAE